MTTYGVTATGFVDKPIEVILQEIQDAQRDPAAFGPSFDVSAQSPEGQFNGIFAAAIREMWEIAQAVYSDIDPDKAIGTGLAAIASLSGTVKKGAVASTVTATVNLNAGKTLKAGAIASVSGNKSARFVTLTDAVNSGGSAADVAVAMASETAGPAVADAGTLTVIESAQTGWNSVTNTLDAVIGSLPETDAQIRVRREQEIRRPGSANADAVKADVEAVPGVTGYTVLENWTDVTDANGLPPKSFMVLAIGGNVDAIAPAIWDSKPDGIEPYGTTSGTAVDADGHDQTIAFTRPSPTTVYLNVHVTKRTSPPGALYPADGDQQIKDALSLWGQENLATHCGEYLVLSQLVPVVFGISGVVDVSEIQAGTSPGPTGTANIAIDVLHYADIETANVAIT